jgi:hypothetical protein
LRPPAKIGSDKLGPMDQVRLSQLNNGRNVAAQITAEPVSVSTGKNAAFATPILALADASWRSACATSGRRSSKSAGRPAGISGGGGFQCRIIQLRRANGTPSDFPRPESRSHFPIPVALLGERGGFGLGGGEFGFGLGDVEFAADAAFETAAHEPDLFMAQIHRAVHRGDFGVERAQPAK